jgi:hypothetical protein
MKDHTTSNACCPICYETFQDIETGNSPAIKLDNCAHCFCRNCIQDFCLRNIATHKIPILCPGQCNEELTQTDLQNVLMPEHETAITKLVRLQKLSSNPFLTQCPRCDEIVEVPTTDKLIDSNQRTCGTCLHVFCILHGDAHPTSSCDAFLYLKKLQLQFSDQLSENLLRRYTKPCPHCGAAIFKESGCDHVVCPKCDGDFCFKCGTHKFLQGHAIRSCSKCKQAYFDHRYQCRHRCKTLLLLPFTVPFWILYTIVALIVCIVSGGFCCCFGWGRYLVEEEKREACSPVSGVKRGIVIVFLPWLEFLKDVGIRCMREEIERAFGHTRDPPIELPTHQLSEDNANKEQAP